MNTRGDVAFFFVLLIYFVLFCSPSWFPVNTCRDIVSLSFFLLFFIYIYIILEGFLMIHTSVNLKKDIRTCS